MIVSVFNVVTGETEAHEIIAHRQMRKIQGPPPPDAPVFCWWTENGFVAGRMDLARQFEREALTAFQGAVRGGIK